jgi:hypothetical protein
MGARSDFVGKPFVPDKIITQLIDHGNLVGASRAVFSAKSTAPRKGGGGSKPFRPKPGDVIYVFRGGISSPNHIFTIDHIERAADKWTFFGIDGGQQIDGDPGGGMSIKDTKRTLEVAENGEDPENVIFKNKGPADVGLVIFEEERNGKFKRPINTWIEFDKLAATFTAPFTEAIRKKAQSAKSPTSDNASTGAPGDPP